MTNNIVTALNHLKHPVEVDAEDFTQALETVLSEKINPTALNSLFTQADSDEMVFPIVRKWAMKTACEWEAAEKRGEKFVCDELESYLRYFAGKREIGDFFYEATGVNVDLPENQIYMPKATKAYLASHVVWEEMPKLLLLAALKKFSAEFKGKKISIAGILDVVGTECLGVLTLREELEEIKDRLTSTRIS